MTAMLEGTGVVLSVPIDDSNVGKVLTTPPNDNNFDKILARPLSDCNDGKYLKVIAEVLTMPQNDC